jgi:hypothetical protein
MGERIAIPSPPPLSRARARGDLSSLVTRVGFTADCLRRADKQIDLAEGHLLIRSYLL